MSVVCKMHCHANAKPVTETENATIRLGAVWENFPSDEARAASENAIFGKYTPWAECNMGIANPDAADFFKPGKNYYLTFTEAPD